MRQFHVLMVGCALAVLTVLTLRDAPQAFAQAGRADNNKKAYQVILKSVTVKDVNKEGNAWDINNGKPDLVVRIKNVTDPTVKQFVSADKEDTFTAVYNMPTGLALENQSIQIEVVDKDLAVEDSIGRTTFVLTPELLKSGKTNLSFDQVSSLTLEFQAH